MESPAVRAERKLNMATKKSSTPVLETPVDEEEKLEKERDEKQQMANMEAELAALKAENERLKKSSIAAYGPAGAKSDHDRVQEACKAAAEAGLDSWNETISIRAPRRPAKEDPFYWLSVNGRTMQVPANDKYFDLPLPFAACLTDMVAAEWFANDFADSIEEYDPVTNPHKE